MSLNKVLFLLLRRKIQVEVTFLPKKFDVLVNNSWCKGCWLCVNICPKKVLDPDEVRGKSVPARVEDCIGCRQCENICPDLAITVNEKGEGNNA